MIRFGLIRHAKTPWNLEKKIQGKSNIALSAEGVRQAGLWKEILMPQKFDLVLSSPLIRARETAQIICDKTPVAIEVDKDLREQDFGRWEGRKIVDIRNEVPGEIELQESRGWEFCPPGGESRTQVLKRVLRAVDRAVKAVDKKQVLIVTHQSVMKILIYHLLGRFFTPNEVPVIKAYHLHVLTWDKKLLIEKINSLELV